MKRVIKMPPNLSGRVTVGDETLEPVLNVEVQYRKINQQICRGDVPALPWVVTRDRPKDGGYSLIHITSPW